MWYSYNGPSWSDNDKKSCNKGAWTAGPLMCDKPGTLSWRVSGYFSFLFFVETNFRVCFANYEARLMIRIALSSASTEAQNICTGLFARIFFAGSSFSLERK